MCSKEFKTSQETQFWFLFFIFIWSYLKIIQLTSASGCGIVSLRWRTSDCLELFSDHRSDWCIFDASSFSFSIWCVLRSIQLQSSRNCYKYFLLKHILLFFSKNKWRNLERCIYNTLIPIIYDSDFDIRNLLYI